jgi:hypothetical protein
VIINRNHKKPIYPETRIPYEKWFDEKREVFLRMSTDHQTLPKARFFRDSMAWRLAVFIEANTPRK